MQWFSGRDLHRFQERIQEPAHPHPPMTHATVHSFPDFPVLGPFLLFSHLLRCLLCFGKTLDWAEMLCVTGPQTLALDGLLGNSVRLLLQEP